MYDDIDKGKCCFNVTFKKYPPSQDCLGVCPNFRLATLQDMTPAPKEGKGWSYCVEIFVFYEARWRICSTNYETAKTFQNDLLISIMKKKSSTITSNTLMEFMKTAKVGEVLKANASWNWKTQLENWDGNCVTRKYLQSPINIFPGITITDNKIVKKFNFGINFSASEFLVSKRGDENVVQFTQQAGSFNVVYNDVAIQFQPTELYFRFPGEHTLDDQRAAGEIIIRLNQIQADQKRWTLTSLELVVPLQDDKVATTPSEFENLYIDYWQFYVNKQGYYQPTDEANKNTKSMFDLRSFWMKVEALLPNYYLYIGSETTPPCENYSLKIVVDKPLKINTCDFKVLRSNTLISTSDLEIHARLIQNDCSYDESKPLSVLRNSYVDNANGNNCDNKSPYVYKIPTLVPPVSKDMNCKLINGFS